MTIGQWVLLAIIFITPLVLGQENDFNKQFKLLNNEFYTLSTDIYQASTLNLPKECRNINNIDELTQSIKALATQKFIVINCISNNLKILYENINDESVSDIAWFLYKSGAPKIADGLLEYSQAEFSDYTTSKIQFHQAKYHFIQGSWEKVIVGLKEADIDQFLSQQEADYAYFMIAVALQNIRQHRDAIKVYNSISEKSQYYNIAQINMAVANLLQGWWTDAHLILKEIIKKETKNKNYELVDRMTLILGFSQLQNEFYRDARESFRLVGIDSPYVNRAMQGIGIAALHQKDFSSALNAFNLLAEQKNIDSYVIQAYLLVPFAHEKLGQKRLAEAKYTQAALYYRKKIALLNQALNKKTHQYSSEAMEAVKMVTKEGDDHDRAAAALSLLNYTLYDQINTKLIDIDKLMQYATSKDEKSKLKKIKNQYQNLKLQVLRVDIVNARAVYQSYLNQCQYALARLYDEN